MTDDETRVSEKTRRVLSEEIEDYQPPTDEELDAWVEEAGPPFPEEEAEPDGGEIYDPSEE